MTRSSILVATWFAFAGLAVAQTASGPAASRPDHPPLDGYDGPVGRIRGRVTLNDEPGADYVVSIWRDMAIGHDGPQWTGDLPIAHTGDDGRFDLGRVPPGEMLLLLSKKDDDWSGPVRFVSDRVELAEGADLDVTMPFEVGVVTGTVTPATGDVLPKGLIVRLRNEDHDAAQALKTGWMTGEARSGPVAADGRFRIDDAQVGSGRLSVTCKDVVVSESTKSVSVRRDEETDAGAIAVLPLVTVSGRVERENAPRGRSPRMRVGFERRVGAGTVFEWADIGSDGSFKIRVVPGSFNVHGTLFGTVPQELVGDPIEIGADGATGIVIVLRPAGR